MVVDHDEISTRIIRYLTSEKGGRVTFIPLNQIRPSRVTYPTGPDVVPLLKKLKYDARFGPAFAQVSISHDRFCVHYHATVIAFNRTTATRSQYTFVVFSRCPSIISCHDVAFQAKNIIVVSVR